MDFGGDSLPPPQSLRTRTPTSPPEVGSHGADTLEGDPRHPNEVPRPRWGRRQRPRSVHPPANLNLPLCLPYLHRSDRTTAPTGPPPRPTQSLPETSRVRRRLRGFLHQGWNLGIPRPKRPIVLLDSRPGVSPYDGGREGGRDHKCHRTREERLSHRTQSLRLLRVSEVGKQWLSCEPFQVATRPQVCV